MNTKNNFWREIVVVGSRFGDANLFRERSRFKSGRKDPRSVRSTIFSQAWVFFVPCVPAVPR